MKISEKLLEMYQLQDAVNTKINPKWKSEGFAFHRAVYIECGEMQDYLQYKWWKLTDLDLKAARMELVDIFHFLISWHLTHTKSEKFDVHNLKSLANAFDSAKAVSVERETLRTLIDRLAGVAAMRQLSPSMKYFIEVMECLELSFDDLYKYYVGKNALNEFRANNGYNEGTYRKIWCGIEDNDHLTDIIENIELEPNDVRGSIMRVLQSCYDSLLNH